MTSAAWTRTRFAERERARGRCERCGQAIGFARFCVVPNGRGHLVFCRSCCSVHFAPVRLAKIRARRLRDQLPLEVS